jgi:hypothetical protein
MDDKDRFAAPAELQADDTISPRPADGKRVGQAEAHRSSRSSPGFRAPPRPAVSD